MKTTSGCIEELLPNRPFIEEALHAGIINYAALAKHLMPEISEMMEKEITEGSVIMALRRYQPQRGLGQVSQISKILKQLGDITVRSNLLDFTFRNSKSLINSQMLLLNHIQKSQDIFYAYTRGVYESNLIITADMRSIVQDCFKNQKITALAENLSSITIQLPEENMKVTGLYYHIFKQIAWEGINLYEVVSTTNEFSIIVEDENVNRAFAVVKKLKQSAV